MSDLLMLPLAVAIVVLGLVYVILGMCLHGKSVPALWKFEVYVMPILVLVFVGIGVGFSRADHGLLSVFCIVVAAVGAFQWGARLAMIVMYLRKK